jgi:putative transposase
MLLCVLLRADASLGRHHLGTLIQRIGIQTLCPQPGTSKRHPQHKGYPHKVRRVNIGRSNHGWPLDMTYIRTVLGYRCLSAIVNVASRRWPADMVFFTLEACHACESPEQAFARFGVPEFINTDQGSQLRPTIST